jgi:hypothetical protein
MKLGLKKMSGGKRAFSLTCLFGPNIMTQTGSLTQKVRKRKLGRVSS